LEGNYKHELHTEADLGLDIDLISMDCDNDADVSNFNEVDEKLLEDEVSLNATWTISICIIFF
jgi:hypothetical protein